MTVPNGTDNPAQAVLADIERVIATLPTEGDTPYTAELWELYRDLAQCLATEPADAACALETMERIQCLSVEDARSWSFSLAGRLA